MDIDASIAQHKKQMKECSAQIAQIDKNLDSFDESQKDALLAQRVKIGDQYFEHEEKIEELQKVRKDWKSANKASKPKKRKQSILVYWIALWVSFAAGYLVVDKILIDYLLK